MDEWTDDQWAGDQPNSVPSHITVPCGAGRKKTNWGTGAGSHSPSPRGGGLTGPGGLSVLPSVPGSPAGLGAKASDNI